MAIKCLLCGNKYTQIESVYTHMEKEHSDSIPKNFTVSQAYYALKTGKDHGKCIICGKETRWNESTHKYNRFCDNPKCKAIYREEFKKRMISKHGKIHLLNDPEQQKKMLGNRSISGKYKWSDGEEITYTGSYEMDFLKFLDIFLQFDSKDIMAPSPHVYTYEYKGENKFYIPDFFIPSLNLEVEVKEGGSNSNMHPKIQAVDKVKEKLKDAVLLSQKEFNYVKITDKNYEPFIKFLFEIKKNFAESDNRLPVKSPIFILGENYIEDINDYQYIAESDTYVFKKQYPAVITTAARDINNGELIEWGFVKVNDSGPFFQDHVHSNLAGLLTYDVNDNGNLNIIKTCEDPEQYDIFACRDIKAGDVLKINWGGYKKYFSDVYDEYADTKTDDNIRAEVEDDVVERDNTVVNETYNYEIKKSNISGKGVFAKIKLTPNVNMGTAFKIKGHTGNADTDYHRTELGKYVNHSSSPNMKIIKNDNEYMFVTNKNINIGEELTVNYNTFDWEGKRDFAKESSEEILEEGVLFSENDMKVNINQWKPEKNKNVLFITGHSGSGRTTLSEDLSRTKSARVINLDLFQYKDDIVHVTEKDSGSGYHKLLWVYFNKVRPDLKNANFHDDIKWDFDNFHKEFIKFFNWILDKAYADPDNLYIIEGIQIMKHFSGLAFKGDPMIVKGTSMASSYLRAEKRAGNSLIQSMKKEITGNGRITYYLNSEKFLNVFKREMLLKESLDGTITDRCPYCGVMFAAESIECDNCGWAFSIENSNKYSRPYGNQEVLNHYGKYVHNKLAKDSWHKYRMDTGIELIHEEPSELELDRIWKNWNEMSEVNKKRSDKKSMELFNMTNEDHYKKLKEKYRREPFYFYHLIPKEIILDEQGLMSPYALIHSGKADMADKALDKYRSRITGAWGIFPMKKPDQLSRNEVIYAINKFKGNKDGVKEIYFFRYPPYVNLGPNMSEVLKTKKIYRIDLNNPELRKLIKFIDWGHDGSHSDNLPLNEKWYRNITPNQYFKNYNDESYLLFANLNHIGIVTENGNIPLKFIELID